MPTLIFLLDFGIFVAAGLSGLSWYLASKRLLRRIDKAQELNRLDLNRMVVAFNRTQALNRRAALATSAAGVLAAVRMLVNLF